MTASRNDPELYPRLRNTITLLCTALDGLLRSSRFDEPAHNCAQIAFQAGKTAIESLDALLATKTATTTKHEEAMAPSSRPEAMAGILP